MPPNLLCTNKPCLLLISHLFTWGPSRPACCPPGSSSWGWSPLWGARSCSRRGRSTFLWRGTPWSRTGRSNPSDSSTLGSSCRREYFGHQSLGLLRVLDDHMGPVRTLYLGWSVPASSACAELFLASGLRWSWWALPRVLCSWIALPGLRCSRWGLPQLFLGTGWATAGAIESGIII